MDIRIQHTKIIKKSDVPHFYQKMLLDFLGKAFFRKFYQFSIQFAVSSVQHTIHKKISISPSSKPNLRQFCVWK